MRRSLIVLALTAVVSASAAPSFAGPITLTTLATKASDPGLVNPWGLASSGSSPLWLGVNGSGTSEIYNGAGVKQGLVVTIPGDGLVTGVVFNTGNAAGGFNGDTFLFASEDGTISGWRGALGTNAETLQLADPDSVYKGLAQAVVSGNDYAYAADFKSGTIDVLKGTAGGPDLVGNFTDPGLPSGYAPFNIQNLGGTLYVTYAVQDAAKEEDVPGVGNGIVSKFDLNGVFQQRVVTGGVLNSPWGLAIAPTGFGGLDGALLVGNFGDGLIHAYDPTSWQPHQRLSWTRATVRLRSRGCGRCAPATVGVAAIPTKSISLPVQTAKTVASSGALRAPAAARAPCRSRRRSYSSVVAWLRRLGAAAAARNRTTSPFRARSARSCGYVHACAHP